MAMPWFKLYPRQFLTDSKVKMLTREHRSILVDLWCYCSEDGGIPANIDDLARLLGESRAVTVKAMKRLQPFFVQQGEQLVSVRMQAEAEAYEEKCQKLKVNGTKGGRPPKPNGKPIAKPKGKPKGLANGLAIAEPNGNQLGGEEEREKALPPKPPRGGGRRRTRVEILEPFQEATRKVVNTLGAEWHEADPADGRKITISPQVFAENVDQILRTQPDLSAGILIEAGMAYLAESRSRYAAPQWFFGAKGDWVGYVRAILTRKGREAVQLQALEQVSA